jgi:hypothetical protein
MSDTPGWTSPGRPDEPDRGGATGEGAPPEPGGQGQAPPPVPPGWSQNQPPPGPPAGQSPPSGGHAWGPPPGAPGGWGWGPQPEVKPGVVPLRPLGVGEILDGAISAMRAHARPMLGLSAVVVTVSQLVAFGALVLLLQDLSSASAALDETSSFDEVLDVFADAAAVAGVSVLLDWVAVIFLTGMLTVVVSRAVLGQRATVGDAWASLRPRLGRLVLVSLLTTAIVLGVGVVPWLPGLALAAAGADAGVTAALLVPGAVASAVLMVWLYVSLALATPALVLEKQTVRGALGRSRRLVRGSWWRVLGILLLAALLTMIIASIIATPFQLVGGGGDAFFSPGGGTAEPSTGALFVATLGQIIGSTLTYPFGAAVTVLLYVDLRMRREGLDLELARAAGLRHPREDAPGPGGPGAGGAPGGWGGTSGGGAPGGGGGPATGGGPGWGHPGASHGGQPGSPPQRW